MALNWGKLIGAGGTGGVAGISLVSTTTGVDNDGDFNFEIDLSGLTGVQDNDIIVLVCVTRPTGDMTDPAPTGWTTIADLFADDARDTNLFAYYKVQGSVPDTTISETKGNNAAAIYTAWCFRGVDTTTPMDVTATTATGINSGIANPPAITPVTSGAVVFVGGGTYSNGFPAFNSSSYLEDAIAYNDGAQYMMTAQHTGWESGSYDPPAFDITGSSDNANSSWCAVTVALRPA